MYTRYAIYYTPVPGALAEFGAAWLGWDAASGTSRAHPKVAGLPTPVAELVREPSRYGLHATLKPPFRLREGTDSHALAKAAAELAEGLAPVDLGCLGLNLIGEFLALTPSGDQAALGRLAAEVVSSLDRFRAPASVDELARRRQVGLTPRQEAMLLAWGYPYTHTEFRFHITLTGALDHEAAEATREALAHHLGPLLAKPLMLDALTLMGEDEQGRFHQIRRYRLAG